MAILATATSKGRINFCGSRGLLSAKLATFSEKLFPPLHNVYFMQNDVTVSFIAQVLDTVTYLVPQVLDTGHNQISLCASTDWPSGDCA